MTTVYDKINEEVRAFFNAGFKSNNKGYDLDAALAAKPEQELAQMLKVDLRNTAKEYSLYARIPTWTMDLTRLEKVKLILKMPVAQRAGNCMEMAEVAGYYAIKKHNFPARAVYIAMMDEPGDHAFCLISTEPVTSTDIGSRRGGAVTFRSVMRFVASPAAAGSMIVDPWLNTVCKGSDYLKQAGTKLEKWSGDGKRVYWQSPSQRRATWHNPSGEYKVRFAQSPVQINQF